LSIGYYVTDITLHSHCTTSSKTLHVHNG